MKRFIISNDNPNASVIRDNARAFIDELDRNKSWAIDIKEHRKLRSLDQNSYIHAVPLKIISDHTGYSVDEIKEYLCGEFTGWETYHVLGKEMSRPVKTTSRMNTLEMTQFIDWMQYWAAHNHGLNIPSPMEYV